MFSRSARYYDAIYAARGKDYAKEAEILHGLIQAHKKSSGNSLLDVGCGTGEHLKHLRQAYEVEGLDLDEAMLEIAQSKLPGIRLHQGDMVDFDLGRKFDVVTNLFSSIGYVRTPENLHRAILNMAKHVHPGGLVVVEPWIYPEDFKPGQAHSVFVDQPDLKIARMNVSRIEDRLSVLDFHYLVASGPELHYFQEKHEVGLFTHGEYLTAFESANLAVAYEADGLDGRGLYIGLKPLRTEE